MKLVPSTKELVNGIGPYPVQNSRFRPRSESGIVPRPRMPTAAIEEPIVQTRFGLAARGRCANVIASSKMAGRRTTGRLVEFNPVIETTGKFKNPPSWSRSTEMTIAPTPISEMAKISELSSVANSLVSES